MAKITKPIKGVFGLGDCSYGGYRVSCIEHGTRESRWFMSRGQAMLFVDFCRENEVNSIDDFEKAYRQFIKL